MCMCTEGSQGAEYLKSMMFCKAEGMLGCSAGAGERAWILNSDSGADPDTTLN